MWRFWKKEETVEDAIKRRLAEVPVKEESKPKLCTIFLIMGGQIAVRVYPHCDLSKVSGWNGSFRLLYFYSAEGKLVRTTAQYLIEEE
jgi:hypothetical protein